MPRVLRSSILLTALLLLAVTAALAGDGWQLRQDDPATQTRVWTRPRPGATPAFRATTVIDARLSSLAAVLLDEGRSQDWVYRARQSELLKRDGPAQGVSRVVTAMPFPLSDREAIVAWEMRQDPLSLVVTLRGTEAQGVPTNEARVRIRNFQSSWTLTPRADGRVDVLFEGQGDPGGNLEGPLLRGFVADAIWEAPWYTIKALRVIVREPGFAEAKLAFIREPER